VRSYITGLRVLYLRSKFLPKAHVLKAWFPGLCCWQVVEPQETLSQKKTNTNTGLVEWLKWYSAYLASVRPQYCGKRKEKR
jgi:hypothetical protein